jgi:5-methylcytosine-specific restriction endonuclease McrA
MRRLCTCLSPRCSDRGIAVSGTSRCRAHTTYGWASKPKWRDAAYTTSEYKTNRKLAIQREPECHWRLPGCTLKSTTADHLVAVSRGGSNRLDNLVGSCRRCNEARGRDLGNAMKRRKPK